MFMPAESLHIETLLHPSYARKYAIQILQLIYVIMHHSVSL